MPRSEMPNCFWISRCKSIWQFGLARRWCQGEGIWWKQWAEIVDNSVEINTGKIAPPPLQLDEGIGVREAKFVEMWAGHQTNPADYYVIKQGHGKSLFATVLLQYYLLWVSVFSVHGKVYRRTHKLGLGCYFQGGQMWDWLSWLGRWYPCVAQHFPLHIVFPPSTWKIGGELGEEIGGELGIRRGILHLASYVWIR